MQKKRFLQISLITAFILASLMLAQCAPQTASTSEVASDAEAASSEAETTASEESAAEDADVDMDDVFVYAHFTTLPNLNPAESYSNDLVVMANCYEGLTFYNAPGSDEILSGKLATSWEMNDDATEWTFYLREGVMFQDGTPFNAEAVKYSIEKTMEIGAGASYIWAPVEEIEVVDDYTVKFYTSYGAPLDLIAAANYAAWIYSPTAFEQYDSDWFNDGNCVGTGPYTIESRERGSRLVMTRFDDYWGGWQDGQFSKIIFDINEDPVVIQQKLEAGEADFASHIPWDNLDKIKENPALDVYSNPSFQNLLGLINTQKPPLDNQLVRQALAYSFPYQDFILGVMTNRATQSWGPVPAGMWGFSEDLFQYSTDLDKAAELLAEAGFADGGFDLTYSYATGNLDEQQAGELWKANLSKLGINLELQGLSWEAQWDLGKSDPMNAQDIFVMYWWPDLISPYSMVYSMFHSEEEILFNLGYYNNPEFDTMIDQANEVTSTDIDQAAELFIDAQEILIDDAAAIFMFDQSHNHILSSDINGFVDNPAYPHVPFVYDMTRE
jgi:peptide/nickel transport system substrate-binding protein